MLKYYLKIKEMICLTFNLTFRLIISFFLYIKQEDNYLTIVARVEITLLNYQISHCKSHLFVDKCLAPPIKCTKYLYTNLKSASALTANTIAGCMLERYDLIPIILHAPRSLSFVSSQFAGFRDRIVA